MNKKHSQEIVDAIEKLLSSQIYWPLTTFLGKLKSDIKGALGIKSSGQNQSEISQILSDLMGDNLRVFKYGRTYYLSRVETDRDIVIEYISQNPGLTPGELQKRLPFNLQRFPEILIKLQDEGLIQLRLRKTLKPSIFKKDPEHITGNKSNMAQPPMLPLRNYPEGQFESRLREAYKKVTAFSKHSGYADIPSLRAVMKVSNKDFDAGLLELRNKGIVVLSEHDHPSDLSTSVVRNSLHVSSTKFFYYLQFRD